MASKKINNPKASAHQKHLAKAKKAGKKTSSYTRGSVLVLAGIILLTLIVFSNSIGNNFVTNWDDKGYLMDNGYIKVITPESIKAIFHSYYNGNYHPLTTISYALEYKFFGFNPKPFHIDNLIIHLLNIVLVFVLMQLLMGRIEASCIAALFFGIHPMHVESISWISERKDVLYTFFYLGALINYIYYLRAEHKKKRYFVMALVLFGLSLLSKSAAISFPVLLLLIDYYHDRKFDKKIVLEKLPFLSFSVAFGRAAGSSPCA